MDREHGGAVVVGRGGRGGASRERDRGLRGLGCITKHVNKSATLRPARGLMHHSWPATVSRAGHLISCSV